MLIEIKKSWTRYRNELVKHSGVFNYTIAAVQL